MKLKWELFVTQKLVSLNSILSPSVKRTIPSGPLPFSDKSFPPWSIQDSDKLSGTLFCPVKTQRWWNSVLPKKEKQKHQRLLIKTPILEYYLEYKFAHFSHFKGTFLEAVEVIICQNKEPLLPPENEQLRYFQMICCHLNDSQRTWPALSKITFFSSQSKINFKKKI